MRRILLVLVLAAVVACVPIEDAPPDNGRPPVDQVFCTQEVQECPDGSFVGRVPPICEFKPCS